MNKHLSISPNNKSVIINNIIYISIEDFKILTHFFIKCVNSNVKLSRQDCNRRSIIFNYTKIQEANTDSEWYVIINNYIKVQEINADSEWYIIINNCKISYMEFISIITKLGYCYSNCKYTRHDILNPYKCNY